MSVIALVDDDRNILTSVSVALESEGFQVRAYSDSAEALQALVSEPPDVAILDIKMPRMDGMELLRRLRHDSDVPVIFLTSKDAEIDEWTGLNLGADDFIRKPVSRRLLAERIRAVLRRARVPSPQNPAAIMERGDLTLDPDRHACSLAGAPVDLTVTEFLILCELARHPGHVKSRDALMDAAYGDHFSDQTYVDERAIDSHIKRLRGKLRGRDPDFDAIETLYGVGYRYRAA